MSTAPFPSAYPQPASQALAPLHQTEALPVRRRASSDQAQAIEKLGNAVDHLSYSRMFLNDIASEKSDAEAIHILLQLRRTVFEECQPVIPTERQWLTRWLYKTSN